MPETIDQEVSEEGPVAADCAAVENVIMDEFFEEVQHLRDAVEEKNV